MAFKKITDYNEERFGNFFLLRNDGDFADVVFLYKSFDDVLVADAHYIKSTDYTGYIHCCGAGCPACAKGIRVQNKLFIPLYNINEGEIQFFDRSIRFQNQLESEVFAKFANPSDYVFRIIRHGAAGSFDTTYEIVVAGHINGTSFDKICADNNVTFPEYYSTVCKDLSIPEVSALFTTTATTNTTSNISNITDMPSYTVTPRASYEPDVSTDVDYSELEDNSEPVF